jgi:UDP-N-acetylglucosamine 4-epimerase
MSAYSEVQNTLRAAPRTWLVTGVAGFIGSHLLETLLGLGQQVVGLDNFATGHAHNLAQVRAAVGEDAWARFRLVEGDIRDFATCQTAVAGVDYVLHQAALGSVPASLEQPRLYHDVNVTGFVNMLEAARSAGVARFVYASSSAVYGDEQCLPAVEECIGTPLSPYALTKALNEQYAHLYATAYGYPSIGFRYFNIFGPRQDPNGAYAAVLPRWVDALLCGDPCVINGDGETTRDYCHVANVVQANLLAATTHNPDAPGRVYNVAMGKATTLNELFYLLRDGLAAHDARIAEVEPVHGPARAGDVRHSVANVGAAAAALGYAPEIPLANAVRETIAWYTRAAAPAGAVAQ